MLHVFVLAGLAAEGVNSIFTARKINTAGYMQQAFFRRRPKGQQDSSRLLRHLMCRSPAHVVLVSLYTTPIFIGAPIVQIWFGQFPFLLDRWFGIAFAAYYCVATPLLYQVTEKHCVHPPLLPNPDSVNTAQ